jgi:hypothetical protein
LPGDNAAVGPGAGDGGEVEGALESEELPRARSEQGEKRGILEMARVSIYNIGIFEIARNRLGY